MTVFTKQIVKSQALVWMINKTDDDGFRYQYSEVYDVHLDKVYYNVDELRES